MRLFVLLLLTTAPLLAAAKRIELGFPGLAHRVQVVFPADYDPEKKWPVVLYYHGTGGLPDTRLIRHHTGEEGWFTVGMTYVQRDQFTFSIESLQKEVNILQSVRRYLAEKYNTDPQRTYVAGFSKGGWIAGLFLQSDPTLAGAVILGAGHVHQVKIRPPEFSRRTPVFIGVGRQDENYPLALNALTFYRGLGASTAFDTWHGLAHQFPEDGSPALTQWFAIERNPEADHAAAAATWAEERLREIKSLPLPVDRWVAVLDMQAAPYHDHLNAADKAAVTDLRTSLERTPVVAPEATLLAAHRKLLVSELKDRSKENYNKLLTAYLDLANSAPESRQGDIARHDHYRIKTILQQQEKAPPETEGPDVGDPGNGPITPPNDNARDDRRRIPGNPLLR